MSVFLARTGHTSTTHSPGPLQRGAPNRPPGSVPLLQCALPAALLPRSRPGPAWVQPEPAPPCPYLHMTDVPPGRPMGAGAAGPDPRAAAAANGLARGGPGLRGRPRGKRGRGGGRCGGGRGARSSGGAGRRRRFGAGLARSARTHARSSVCPPGAGGRPGAEPRAPGPERRGAAPATGALGARAVTRQSCEGGRERASERGKGGGRPRARAPRPAPPAPPARLRTGGGRRRGRRRWPGCRAPRDGPRARRGAGRGRRALTSPRPPGGGRQAALCAGAPG